MTELTNRDVARLLGTDLDLIRVVRRCFKICPLKIFVIQGLRSPEEGAENFRKGVSQTRNSRHLHGFAVDLGLLTPEGSYDKGSPAYTQLNQFMQAAATAEDVPLIWGGSWKTLKDLGHWELSRSKYPDPKPST